MALRVVRAAAARVPGWRRGMASARVMAQPCAASHPELIKNGQVMPGVALSEFQERRAALQRRLQPGVVALLVGQTERFISNDIPIPFRQDSNMLYLTGFLEPDALLVVPSSGKCVLFVPPEDAAFSLWNGPRAGVSGAAQVFGFPDAVYSNADVASVLPSILSQQATVGVVVDQQQSLPSVLQSVPKLLSEAGVPVMNALEAVLADMRVVKSDAEVALMRDSASLAAQAMTAAMQATRPGVSEAAIASVFEHTCKMGGAERLAYPCVVGSGDNALTLHYIMNDCVAQDGALVLMDAGCERHGYASDITRTFPVSGRFSAPQRAVYEVVLDVQRQCIDMVRPGVTMNQLHAASVEAIIQGLARLGVPIQQAREHYRLVYPHSIGHMLGLDVHDCQRVPGTKPLSPGMVLTIEPGLYLPRLLSAAQLDVPGELLGIGVRIEDDVLVTRSGHDVLTRDVVKDVDSIEQVMAAVPRRNN